MSVTPETKALVVESAQVALRTTTPPAKPDGGGPVGPSWRNGYRQALRDVEKETGLRLLVKRAKDGGMDRTMQFVLMDLHDKLREGDYQSYASLREEVTESWNQGFDRALHLVQEYAGKKLDTANYDDLIDGINALRKAAGVEAS